MQLPTFRINRELKQLRKEHNDLMHKVDHLMTGQIRAEQLWAKDVRIGLGSLQFGAFQKMKTAAETVNNSAVLQDDDTLVIASGLSINSNYLLIIHIVYTSSNVADFKTQLVPSDAADIPICTAIGFDTNGNQVIQYDNGQTALAWGGVAGPSTRTASWIGTLRIGASGGGFKIQWAQNTAEATNTTVDPSSWMLLAKIT